MSQLTLIESIKKETKINDKGHATVSIRGAARIVGVKHQTLSIHFKGASLDLPKIAEKPVAVDSEGAILEKKASGSLEPSKLAEKLASIGFEGDSLEQFSMLCLTPR